MGNNEFLLIRHAETKIIAEKPVSKWDLSTEGYEQSEKLTTMKEFFDIDIIISSFEKKAYLTVKPIAIRDSRPIIQFYEFNELDRDNGGFLSSKDEYDLNVRNCMSEIEESFNNWETASHALNRFSRKMKELDRQYDHKRILISSHGIILNLYFAKILNQLDFVFERWKKTTFCDFGIIKDGFVVLDIVKQ